jgi:MFS superfamily sulfate permease-like transporter
VLLRAIAGIIVGDVIFAGSAVLLFRFAGVDPHSMASPAFIGFSILYGIIFAGLGGFIAGIIGRRPDVICGILLAVVIAVGAITSLVTSPGGGAIFTQSAALILMAPAALVGDWIRKSRKAAAG